MYAKIRLFVNVNFFSFLKFKVFKKIEKVIYFVYCKLSFLMLNIKKHS